MNAPIDAGLLGMSRLAASVAQACDRIAPTWPLDRFIAVNPYWGWRGESASHAAARLGVIANTRLTMPRAWFREHWLDGRLRTEHLQAAIDRSSSAMTAGELALALGEAEPALARLPLVSRLRDADDPQGLPSWSERVIHQIGQHCAAWFDHDQARWAMDRTGGLYPSWTRQMAMDLGLPWRSGRRSMRSRIAALEAEPMALIAQALDALGIDEAARTDYLSALLHDVQGWAAWCAWERWQARLEGAEDRGGDEPLVHLLAIRLAWEWLLQADARPGSVPAGWPAAWLGTTQVVARLEAAQRVDWLLQLAMEIAYQQPLCADLLATTKPETEATPSVQAVFCIDVRSELLRRALEAADARIHTRGFAGFFGLPIAYRPLGSALTRPQLPGLLAPALTVSERSASAGEDGVSLGERLAERRRSALGWRQRWSALRGAAASGFSFVETCGLAYGAKLLGSSLRSTASATRWEDTGLPAEARNRTPVIDGLPLADAAAMAHRILQAMGLTRSFAPLVLLAGHGSHTRNNAHAAGLDCGACGGQGGEVNARALAELLNRPALREALAARGVAIPAGTHFLPGLHNTTTDELRLFDTDTVPAPLQGALAMLRRALDEAARRARAERAPGLGLAALADQPEALGTALRQRANDWAQTRPEWGLADNAALIVAPRARTQHINLAGRSFLHCYDWREDIDGSVLELIMTAPMVVTNWINLQYHASSVDPRRYGSGNKLLHNVVGGHLGVFEGNGGDLRIGLPWQSVHDGKRLRHTPLRLSVFVEAPRAAIDAVVAKHAVVRELVGHGWLHLLRIDPEGDGIETLFGGRWQRVATAADALQA